MAVCGASTFAEREMIMCVFVIMHQLAFMLHHDIIMSSLLMDLLLKTYLILVFPVLFIQTETDMCIYICFSKYEHLDFCCFHERGRENGEREK